MKFRNTYIAMACAAVLALTSCSSGKTVLPYFVDLDESTVAAGVEAQVPALKIMPDDELLINVSATSTESVEPYMIPYQRPRTSDLTTGSSTEARILSQRSSNLMIEPYRVSPDGFIVFPVLGRIYVAGMTLEALQYYLTQKISANVIDPVVNVSLLNFHISVLGEVNNGGFQAVNRERYSVLDAIATAGDLTAYGERSNVLLIREEDGQRTFHRLDLNDPEVLNSPYFYMQQNDVLYVTPNSVRQANARVDSDRQYRLSMTSVIVSAASVIASLAIALLVK